MYYDEEEKVATIVSIDLRESLPKIREAFDNKTLQVFTRGVGPDGGCRCLYSGPCAVGVCVPEHLRKELDSFQATEIDCLIDLGAVSIPEDQAADLVHLQDLHDVALNYKMMCYRVDEFSQEEFDNHIASFESLLVSLEEKYSHNG